jgi:predicted dehydrogenase
MTGRPLKVGLIGASPTRGFAHDAHAPALKATPGVELAAIANRSLESARLAADALGASQAYGDLGEMLASDIDLAVVTVRVTEHLQLVDQVLDAGKMVLCEWPLGRNLAEAEAMADHARRVGVKGFVGLQMRQRPVIRYMSDLIAEGFIGDILSATLLGSSGVWDSTISEDNEYLATRANGGTMLSIVCAHTMDGLCSLVGEFEWVQAVEGQRRTTTTVVPAGRTIAMDSPDQVLINGLLECGAPVSVHYRSGLRGGTPMMLEINGTRGSLKLTGTAGGGQTAGLTLDGCGNDSREMQRMLVPDRYVTIPSLAERAEGVAAAYAQIAADWREGTTLSSTFDHAVVRHRLLDAIERSAKSGEKTCI